MFVVAAGALAGCGGSVDLVTPGADAAGTSGDGDALGGNTTSTFGGRKGVVGGQASEPPAPSRGGRAGQNASECSEAFEGGTTGYDVHCADPLTIVPAGPPRDRGHGGNGPLPPLEGWLGYDVVKPFGAGRGIELRAADRSCTRWISDASAQEKQPDFSDVHGLLAYASNRSGKFQIEVRHLPSGRSARVTDVPEGATYPSWSPDGERIVFVTNDPELDRSVENHVGVVNVSTLEVELFTPPGRRGFTKAIFVDEDSILVGNGTSLVAIRWSTGEVRDVVPITNRIPNPRHPTLAPGGEIFGFVDYCGVGTRLFAARVDGTTGDTCEWATLLTQGELVGFRAPDWGPFGYLATILETNGTQELLLVRDDGSGQLETAYTTESGQPDNPTWANDSFALSCD